MELEVFLDHFVDWAATRPDVAAVVLVGSHARRTATPNSDVDLVVLCSFADGLLREDWPGLFGDVTSSSIEGFGALRSRRILYRDGVEVEFGIAERSWARVPLDSGTARVLGAGVRILYDPDEVVAKAIAAMNGSTDARRMVQIERVILEGRFVRLEPISLDHVDGMVEAGREWDLTPERVRAGIESTLREQAAGTSLPFATIERASGRVVGGTRLLRIVPEHRRLEIGSTWIGAPWRRTAINTEAKFLMLEHAFERLRCIRVEFVTDVLHEVSRKSILRLGAVEEGTLRRYHVAADGSIQDAVVYSIIESEWPAVRARLRVMLDGPSAA